MQFKIAAKANDTNPFIGNMLVIRLNNLVAYYYKLMNGNRRYFTL